MALVSHTTVSQIRAKLAAKGDVGPGGHVIDTRGRRQPRIRKRAAATSVAPIVSVAIAKPAPALAPAYPPAPSKSKESGLLRQIDKMAELAREGLALTRHLSPANCDDVRHKLQKIIEIAITDVNTAPKPVLAQAHARPGAVQPGNGVCADRRRSRSTPA
jgi:hypothetical protein